MIVCPELKHKVDRYVNIVNVVLFAKTSIIAFNGGVKFFVWILILSRDISFSQLSRIEALGQR